MLLILRHCVFLKLAKLQCFFWDYIRHSQITHTDYLCFMNSIVKNNQYSMDFFGENCASWVKDCVKVVRSNMENLMSMVQNAMRANRLIAIKICTDCGFEHKKITIRGPRENAANPSTEAGVLIVEFTGGGQYHIQMSSDGGLTWVNCDPTKRAGVVVRNLNAKTYLFRGRKVLANDAYGDWVGPIEGTPL